MHIYTTAGTTDTAGITAEAVVEVAAAAAAVIIITDVKSG